MINIIIAVLSFIGTAIGSITGVLTANHLMLYRIEQLEKKIDKFDKLGERVALLEKDSENHKDLIDELFEKIRTA